MEGRKNVSNRYPWLLYLQMAHKIRANGHSGRCDFGLTVLFVLQICAVNEGFLPCLMFQILKTSVLANSVLQKQAEDY